MPEAQQAPSWQNVDVFGGMDERDYAKLPEPYKAEVEALWQWAQRRDAMHQAGGSVTQEEMDKSGARENDLQLPPMVNFKLRRIMQRLEANLHMLLADDLALVDEAQALIDAHGQSPQHHRYAAEMLVENNINNAGMMLAVGVEETLINGLKHGVHGDLRKKVVVRQRVDEDTCVIEVEDDGLGYVRSELPDPLTALESGHGRGLLLTDEFAERVERNERGTLVTIYLTRKLLRDRVIENMQKQLDPNEPDKVIKTLQSIRTDKYVVLPVPPASSEEPPMTNPPESPTL